MSATRNQSKKNYSFAAESAGRSNVRGDYASRSPQGCAGFANRNDPDAVCLAGDLPLTEFQFHATAIYASGGMLLSGDDLTKIEPHRLQMLRKLLPPTGVAARFEDDALNVGIISLPDAQMVCVLNWEDEPKSFRFKLAGKGQRSARIGEWIMEWANIPRVDDCDC